MRHVYILQHSYDLDGCDETKLIGVYSTRKKAQARIRRLRNEAGFKDRPEDFYIGEYTLDMDHWTEGFVTMRGTRQVRTRRAKSPSRVSPSNKSLERTRDR